MAFQRRGILLRSPLFENPQPAQVPVATDDCEIFAIHDLAALAEGNLSPDGMRRLAGHIHECPTCRATLAAIVEDTQSSRGTGDTAVSAWLAMATPLEDLRSSIASTDEISDGRRTPLPVVTKRS
jgi:hypothetical protein